MPGPRGIPWSGREELGTFRYRYKVRAFASTVPQSQLEREVIAINKGAFRVFFRDFQVVSKFRRR